MYLSNAEENLSSKAKVVKLSYILHVFNIKVFLFQYKNNLPMKTMSTTFFIQKGKKNYFQKSLRYNVNFPVNTKPLKLTKA